jgi:hypothetical protein
MSNVDNSGWVWLEFPGTGGRAQFAPAAAGLWRAKGWVDCDPAPEPNRLKDPTPESEVVPINEPVTKQTKPAQAGDKEENRRG